jgi:hypothetical protein
MSVLQQYQFWIGLGFVLVLLILLVIIFFKVKNLTSDQRSILKFFISLCAGFSGALITGQILFNLEGNLGSGAKFGISSSAGFALFLIIWFFFPTTPNLPPPPEDSINFSVPEGWTFQQVVEVLSQIDNSVVEYEGFTSEELHSPLKEWKLKEKTISDAIRRLRSITKETNKVRKYNIRYSDSTYFLTIEA